MRTSKSVGQLGGANAATAYADSDRKFGNRAAPHFLMLSLLYQAFNQGQSFGAIPELLHDFHGGKIKEWVEEHDATRP